MNTEQKLTLKILLGIILMAGVITGLVRYKVHQETVLAKPMYVNLTNPEGAPPFTNLNGDAVDLVDENRKIHVVLSWATWNPSSVDDLRNLARLSEKFKERAVVFIAINRSEPKSTVDAFLPTFQIDRSLNLILDPDDRYYRSALGHAMPETIIYDFSGDIVQHKRGPVDSQQLEKYIEEALSLEVE